MTMPKNYQRLANSTRTPVPKAKKIGAAAKSSGEGSLPIVHRRISPTSTYDVNEIKLAAGKDAQNSQIGF
jgi:hypothetical protein